MATPSCPPVFQGIWLPLVTPFAHGAVDHRALRRMVEYYVGTGVAGFVPLGTTGEAYALDGAEYDAVLDTVLDAAGPLPVIAGLGGMHVPALVQRATGLSRLRTAGQAAAAHGLAGLLVAAPPYIRPSQDALLTHFQRLADASAVPLVLYDIPYRTGVTLNLETLLTLAAHPNIVAVKDCGGSVAKTLALIADGRLAVLAGDDLNVLATLCMGGAGAIVASANVAPRRFARLHEAVRAQRLDEARAIFHALVPLIGELYAEPNPAPLKACLAANGWMSAEVRAPLLPASAALAERLAAVAVDPAIHP